MEKAHQVENLSITGNTLRMTVDGRPCKIDLASVSSRLAHATDTQRGNVEVSPSGYGLRWPEIDEDLAIDGLIGARDKTATSKSQFRIS